MKILSKKQMEQINNFLIRCLVNNVVKVKQKVNRELIFTLMKKELEMEVSELEVQQ
jgi:hypothetical protein